MWSLSQLHGIAVETIRDAEARLDTEQAVSGLDALSEVRLHAIVAEGLARAGLGVLREQRLPGVPESRPAERERERCDLVLLPDPQASLEDPVRRAREQDLATSTLFEQSERARASEGVLPQDAFWLEVKVVGQFVVIDGAARANQSYAGQLVNAIVQDVRKLSKDVFIERGAALLILFTADAVIARHDLDAALHRCLDRGVPIGVPEVDCVPIADRIGNACCLVAMIPARKDV